MTDTPRTYTIQLITNQRTAALELVSPLTLNQAQTLVEGPVELIADAANRQMLVNEEGWLLGLPRNTKAEFLLHSRYGNPRISGTAIILTNFSWD